MKIYLDFVVEITVIILINIVYSRTKRLDVSSPTQSLSYYPLSFKRLQKRDEGRCAWTEDSRACFRKPLVDT